MDESPRWTYKVDLQSVGNIKRTQDTSISGFTPLRIGESEGQGKGTAPYVHELETQKNSASSLGAHSMS